MALPTVAINNATGSDSAASGAGPSTALTGSLAATHANTTVNITDVVDLSAVATDGSAVLWVLSSSGKQFAKISTISGSSGAWVVTVANAYANTESGKTWAIGGKRASIGNTNTRQLFQDFLAGWTIDIQDTQPALTTALAIRVTGTAANPAIIKSTAGTAPTITTATNSINLFDVSSSTFIQVSNLAFTNTAGTKGTSGSTGCALTCPSGTCPELNIDKCSFDGFQIAIVGDNITNFSFQKFSMTRSEVKNSVSDGARLQTDFFLDHCRFKSNGGHGISTPTNSIIGPWAASFCEFAGNTGSGIRLQSASAGGATTNFLTVTNCTFRDNGAAGVKIDAAAGGIFSNLSNNIFYNNTTYGIDFTNSSSAVVLANYNNAYGANGTNPSNNLAAGSNDITLTASPFNSSSDSGLNSTAGGGTACKAQVAVPPNSSSNTAADIGAVPSGGGTISTDPGIANVRSGTSYTINGSGLTGTLVVGGIHVHPGMTANIGA